MSEENTPETSDSVDKILKELAKSGTAITENLKRLEAENPGLIQREMRRALDETKKRPVLDALESAFNDGRDVLAERDDVSVELNEVVVSIFNDIRKAVSGALDAALNPGRKHYYALSTAAGEAVADTPEGEVCTTDDLVGGSEA